MNIPVFAPGLIVAATLILIALIIIWVVLRRKRRIGSSYRERNACHLGNLLSIDIDKFPTQLFSYQELKRATKSFSPDWRLGNGAFGTVYAGRLQDGRLVAVKKIHDLNIQGLGQVLNEVKVLSESKHRNLVLLLGCCLENVDPLIVFEYLPNGTLAEHLQRERGAGLDWFRRITIAADAADALAYLHSVDPP
eukprot:c1120_g2_i1 orf=1-576(-)